MKVRIRKLKLKFVLGFFLLISIVFCLALHFVAPFGIIQPPKKNESLIPDDLNLNFEKLEILGQGQINLIGYLINSNIPKPKAVMILIHGIGGCKEHFLPLAKDLAQLGIASVVVDVRAHGESGGEFCTYGYYEKQDVSKIVDYIQNKYSQVPIGIWGNSMGGAIAIQSLEFDERINFGIIESTFTSLEQIVIDYQTRIFKGIALPTVSKYALKRAGEIANFDPGEVCPIESVKQIEQAVFIAHGDLDENISIEYGKELFNYLKSVNKEFYPVAGGGHFGLFQAGGEDYVSSILTFIKNQINDKIEVES